MSGLFAKKSQPGCCRITTLLLTLKTHTQIHFRAMYHEPKNLKKEEIKESALSIQVGDDHSSSQLPFLKLYMIYFGGG